MGRGSDSEQASTRGRSAQPRATDSPLLDALFSDAPIGLGSWDAELRFQRVNPVLAAINGVPAAEHPGRRIADVLPRLGPQLEELCAEILATGEPVHDRRISGETPAAPGVERHWVASYFPVRGDDGRPVGVAATVVEVTDERQATALVQRAQRREHAIDAQLRAVYAALPVGVGFVTPDLRYERVNEALALMNGRSVDAHIGRTVQEVLGEHGELAAQAVRQVMARREPIELELTTRTSASPDEQRFFEATYFPVFGPDGEPLGVGAVVRDVTERHRMELERDELLREAVKAREAAERQGAEAEHARRRASFLATVTGRMSASLDYEATLQEVAAAAVPYIADWCAITVVEPGGRLRLLAVAHAPADVGAPLGVGSGEPVTGELFEAGRVIVSGTPVVRMDLDPRAVDITRADVRHYGTWPIRAPSGETIGALSLVLADSGRRFSADDIELARAVASRAGLHISNARLHTERSEIARTLQASLLPRHLPQIPGIDLASAFRPAGEENIVGGDFYDVFQSGEGVWTAILGDVSGKGAQAAALTSTARHTLRAAALNCRDPAPNVALLNRVLSEDFGGAQFCTAVYARLCPTVGRLTVRMTSGGHPPAIIVRASGAIEPVAAGRGPAIGALPEARFDETSVALESGDLLFLYTDGVTELRPGGIVLGEQELHRVLRRRRHGSVQELVDGAVARALELHGGAARDDMTMLAVGVSSAD